MSDRRSGDPNDVFRDRRDRLHRPVPDRRTAQARRARSTRCAGPASLDKLDDLRDRLGADDDRIVPVIGDLSQGAARRRPPRRSSGSTARSSTSSTSPRSTTSPPTPTASGSPTSRAPGTRCSWPRPCTPSTSTRSARSRPPGCTRACSPRTCSTRPPTSTTTRTTRPSTSPSASCARSRTVPWRVYRPGIVVGRSETGEIDKIDGPYYFFRAIQRLRGVTAVVAARHRHRGRPDQHRARSTTSPRRWTTSPTSRAWTGARST